MGAQLTLASWPSCVGSRITSSVGELDRLFHVGNFLVRKEVEVAGTLAGGKPAVVLQAGADEEVDLPIRHVHDFLNGLLGTVIAGQESQLFGEFRTDGPLTPEKRLRHENYRYFSCSGKKNAYGDTHTSPFVARTTVARQEQR
jgi:hypothetical protein